MELPIPDGFLKKICFKSACNDNQIPVKKDFKVNEGVTENLKL